MQIIGWGALVDHGLIPRAAEGALPSVSLFRKGQLAAARAEKNRGRNGETRTADSMRSA